MRDFDPDYVDIVDYIVRCTHKIWEEGAIGLIYSHYQHNAVIHTSDGLTYGRDKVIADSLRTLAAFPDIRLYADDVIWSGNDTDGYHSSHRIGWVGIGETSVAIAVSAPHREHALAACKEAIDTLKVDVPLWKKEVYEGGEEWIGRGS